MPNPISTVASPPSPRLRCILAGGGLLLLGAAGDEGSDLFVIVVILGIVVVFLLGVVLYLARAVHGSSTPAQPETLRAPSTPRAQPPPPVPDRAQATRMVARLPFADADADRTVPLDGSNSSRFDDEAPTTVVPNPPPQWDPSDPRGPGRS